jgi:phosphoribosylamine--glycine ligase
VRFRLLSKYGDGLGLAHRIHEEGHKVDFWVKKADAKPSFKGILPQREAWNLSLTKDTFIFFDMVGMGPLAESLKKAGFDIYGGGKLNDTLELNREFGLKAAKTYGLKVPKYKAFKSFAKAIEFVAENGGAWVFKPENNQLPVYTYVSTDTEDMLEMLGYFKKMWQGKVDFVLQEKIDGIEISVEGFYLDGELVPNSLNSTLESKRFMEGNKGENTGCQGSLVWFWKKKEPKIYRLSLKRIEPFLRRFKYSGPLDCNCIVSGRDQMPYFLEWTARFGYSAIYALAEGLNVSVSDFIGDLAAGEVPSLKPSYDWLGAVRVSIPPYPHDKGLEKSANKPIRGVDSFDHTWLLDAKRSDDKLLTAGVDGVVCEVTGRHKELGALEKELYARIDKLKIPDKQYRSDIIAEGERRLNKLREWRYF